MVAAMFFSWLRLMLVSGLAGGAALRAAEADINAVTSAGAVDNPVTAMRKFRLAPGLKVDLFAAEPMLQNVVSFGFDEQGRCYAVESNRRRTSVFDIRNLPEWLDADFSFRTVEQRAAFLKEKLSPADPGLGDFLRSKRNLLTDLNRDGAIDWRDLVAESERIRLLVDRDGDGHADSAAVLAEGFDGITSGVAAGVLARRGEVWFTCIPDLWQLSISNQLSAMDAGKPFIASNPHNPTTRNSKPETQNLLSGFGVHIAFGGHDLHGLKMGPEGKIYFSIADRGASTNLWSRIIDHWPGLTMEALADSGAVFRCNPDGTALEVIAIGLRNPQELAFDDWGNLFTGDNNGDGGDKARWEYVVPGADYGWRMGWQWLPKMGAWNSEMLWGLAPSNTSAYHLPPVAHIGAGPSGVAFYPGTGLPARYDRHFFLCDFRGGPNSLVHSFALRPRGAGFEAHDETEFITGFLCTDVEFGPDGGVYVSDWVKGWDKTDKGRIYRVTDPVQMKSLAVIEVRKLLAEGFSRRSEAELARLLGHQDQRVRLEAQWELAARALNSDAAFERLSTTAEKGETRARLHAVWGLAQIAQAGRDAAANPKLRKRGEAARQKLWYRTGDGGAEIRGQAAKLYWEAETSAGWFPDLVSQPNPRVQFLAIQGLAAAAKNLNSTPKGKQFASNAVVLLREVLRQNADADPYLRHAAVFALGRIGDVNTLLTAANDPSPSVRMGVCLALRRLARPEVARFLADSDPRIALEAARAIHDVPIAEALPALAGSSMAPASRWRAEDGGILNATWRRVLNANFRLGSELHARRLADFAANAEAPDALRTEALELLALWPKPPGRDHVVGLWRPLSARETNVAASAVKAVTPTIESGLSSAVKLALKKTSVSLGISTGGAAPTGSAWLAKLNSALSGGSLADKQAALVSLTTLNEPAATTLLNTWVEKLATGGVPKELQLDVLEAAQKISPRLTPAATTGLKRFESARDPKDALGQWREVLYGGNAEEGKKTFIERQDAACFRCHKANGEGGEVGPELTGLGQKQSREYILESILYPNKNIAPGFETVLVTLKNGSSYAGMIKSETADQLVINSPEDGPVTVKKADIQSRDRGLSAMPEELGSILSKQDLRNLVEFLSTLK